VRLVVHLLDLRAAWLALAGDTSMWQLDSAATNASSGSTFSATACGNGTMCGDADAGTTRPPSNAHSWARL